MKIQMYYIKMSAVPTMDKIIGGAVYGGTKTGYNDNDSNIITGFIFDYKKDTNVIGICLWEPIEFNTGEVLYYEEKVDYLTYFQKMLKAEPECAEFWMKVISNLR